jgi:signal transduction histidine kinase
MCKKISLFIIVCYACVFARAQNTETDSLKKLLTVTNEDSKRVIVLEGLSYAYLASYPDTALKYALQGLELAKETNNTKGEALCTNALGNVYFHIGNNAKALEFYLRYLQLKEGIKGEKNFAVAYFNIASAYTEEGDYQHALEYLFKAKKEDEKLKDTSGILFDYYSLGSIYLRMQKADSALYNIKNAYNLAMQTNDENMIGAILNTYGEIYAFLKKDTLAAQYYNLSIPYVEAINDNEVLTSNYYGLAKIYKEKNIADSSIYFARKALSIANNAPFLKQVLEISSFLTDLFRTKKQFDSAFYYQGLSIATKDSLFNIEEVRKVQNLKFQEQQRQQAIETARIKLDNKIKLFIVIFISLIFLAIAILLWHTNKQKQKTNVLLQQQKEKVESTLSELKSTQTQLIQSEKMASLGELTAGIAHEIQNPLNFVNNFSEVNKELVSELLEEVDKRNYVEAIVIANDIKDNSEKINFHGKRAGDIVKGMLQHSRKGTGAKEPVDINTLADEYLRLSYHGLRAKDKNFNAEVKTNFDETLEKINIIPQDIGRVFLNLFNNAFYAVSEKQKAKSSMLKAENNAYVPAVTIVTKKINDKVEIRVSDNGNGIQQNIIDKIFQPFFTTKPTGQGTGLGLSLSYEIIKAHDGEIRVESKEGEGTEFIINLPLIP